MYKLYETEVQKLFDEHLENFKIHVPSVNHDYLCIRFLNKELKEIAAQHRAQRVLDGQPRASTGTRICSAAKVVRSVVNIEEPAVGTGEPQAPNNERQAHDAQIGKTRNLLGEQQELPSSGENPTQFEDPYVNTADHVNNLGTNPISEENYMDHQGPTPSTQQMVVYTGDSEEDTRISFLEDSDSSHTGSQQMFISSHLASPHASSKLEEVEKSTRSVLGKCVYLVTLVMSPFDLQDVCIAIGSIATLDLPMVVDLIGIYGLKGPYCTLTTTNWFLQALSVIPRGSWGDVARRFTMIRWATAPYLLSKRRRRRPPCAAAAAVRRRRKFISGQLDEENPFVQNSSVLLVQADEGVSVLVVDRIGDIYRSLPRRADVIVTTVGARHNSQVPERLKIGKTSKLAADRRNHPPRPCACRTRCAPRPCACRTRCSHTRGTSSNKLI
ncbi:hypothetical protein F511_24834 [Dorcoceras hygrometricum]|uniref:Uncharacterized protein n=1 Tax=Dorcoceras hygrometricum TaxID=472368 RepID=A0A2Z7ATV9_9LAMI|nr:hypothetical protein F511_24834 [Dorcoceras hygrometricum]